MNIKLLICMCLLALITINVNAQEAGKPRHSQTDSLKVPEKVKSTPLPAPVSVSLPEVNNTNPSQIVMHNVQLTPGAYSVTIATDKNGKILKMTKTK